MACAAVVLLAMASSHAFALDPLQVVRNFCRADALGDRLDPHKHAALAALVSWPLDPAWDHISLIKGYQISTPRQEENAVTVDVTYTLAAEVRAGRVLHDERLEVHAFRLSPDESTGTLRILGPPPCPHVFDSLFDANDLAADLDPQNGRFMSNSAFVWAMLVDAGWTLPYLDTVDLARAPLFSRFEEAATGDLAFYYDGDDPYHVGFVTAPGVMVSATLNGGIRRTPLDTFAGEMRFMRFTGNRPHSEQTPTPTETDAGGAVQGTRPEAGATAAESPSPTVPD
jgi:hypothetical protein